MTGPCKDSMQGLLLAGETAIYIHKTVHALDAHALDAHALDAHALEPMLSMPMLSSAMPSLHNISKFGNVHALDRKVLLQQDLGV